MGRDPEGGTQAGGRGAAAEEHRRSLRRAGALSDRPDERDEDRPEDREDDTDRAIKLAREHCIHAVSVLSGIMYNDENPDYRMKAAIAILEVAGCL